MMMMMTTVVVVMTMMRMVKVHNVLFKVKKKCFYLSHCFVLPADS
jgi:hypothetical protein